MKKDYGLTMRGIIRNENNEILILKRHPKSRTDPNTWELPGGKVEAGEFFDDALIREIKEETNLDCEIGDLAIAIQHDYSFKRTVQMIMYLENVKGELKISEEHIDSRWASVEDMNSLPLSGCLEKVLEKKEWKE